MKTGNFRTLSAAVASLALALTCYQANASFYTVGDPVGIGSWGQGQTWYQSWLENNVGPFDQIEVWARPTGNSVFANPGLAGFSVVTWQDYNIDASHVVGADSSTTSLQFNTFFTIAPTTTFSIDLYAWNGNSLADSVRATWDGSTWTYGTADTSTRTIVPEPTALLFLPFGAWLIRSLRKNRAA